jgi:hypothetical protein
MRSMLQWLSHCLLGLALAGAVADTGFAQGSTLPAVRPGDGVVDGRLVRPGATERHMVIMQNDTAVRGATVRTVIAEVPAGREPGLLVANTITSPRGTIYDTSLVRRRTLEPVWHHSTQPRRRMRLAFGPDSVTGSVTPTDSAAILVAQATAAPTFDSAVMDQVIASLPLARGYAARLPLYIYERGGLVWFDVHVTAEEPAPGAHGGRTPAWVVRLDEPEMSMRYWVARGSRQLLRSEFDLGQGRRMVMTL